MATGTPKSSGRAPADDGAGGQATDSNARTHVIHSADPQDSGNARLPSAFARRTVRWGVPLWVRERSASSRTSGRAS